MIHSCVTISLVKEAKGGPFVFWDSLPDGCCKAAELGFEAVEVFPPAPDAVDSTALRNLLDQHGLKLAAVGTGAGWVIRRLTLTHPDPAERRKAQDFVRSIIDLAGSFQASAIIGSMQGRWGDGVDRLTALGWLAESLQLLGDHARQYGVPLIYEPLNRYETNLINTVADGVDLLHSLSSPNVVLLADLFHMNIEETNIADALRTGGRHIGHVHFVDSNRRPAGCGHLDLAAVGRALKDIGYNRYASAEAFAYPNSDEAARLTIEAFRKYLA
ncbi:MAG TPA: sugar phosphate isomerase/epimerase family protein [Planctomycetaceae bacterium]|nr:sugar phosphate isomerase/epimerase family protein [Planctomycetaceae bacterium]